MNWHFCSSSLFEYVVETSPLDLCLSSPLKANLFLSYAQGVATWKPTDVVGWKVSVRRAVVCVCAHVHVCVCICLSGKALVTCAWISSDFHRFSLLFP